MCVPGQPRMHSENLSTNKQDGERRNQCARALGIEMPALCPLCFLFPRLPQLPPITEPYFILGTAFYFPQELYEVSDLIMPVLQMRKLRFRELNVFPKVTSLRSTVSSALNQVLRLPLCEFCTFKLSFYSLKKDMRPRARL